VPFNDPKPPAEYPPKPGATLINCVKSRPFNGISWRSAPVTSVVCVSVVVSSTSVAADTSTVVACCEIASLASSV
jgi:hypothetical protein